MEWDNAIYFDEETLKTILENQQAVITGEVENECKT